MKLAILRVLSLALCVAATGPIPVSRTGLAGIAGFTFYNPYCGHGCFRSFAPYKLPCSTTISPGGHTTADEAAHNLALCRASNFPYLSSIAWCMHLYCPEDVRASTIEHFWETQITGDVKILPEWSYGEVLANITEPPTMMAMDKMMVLNMTMLTSRDNWEATWLTLYYFFRESSLESYYGLSICLTAFALPILLTWLRYLPFMSGVLQRIKPWLYPSIFGTYHDNPLPLLLGNVPTVGQSLYIAVVGILNVIFLAVGYKTLYPERVFQWYNNHYQELLGYVMWRTGILAFCQMPILFLFATRNNMLLWLTNWSYTTYLLLHRWVARFFLFQVVIHSIVSLVLYVNDGSYSKELKTPLWIWGCVATVITVVIVLSSVLFLRKQTYELFLLTHIIMAVLCVVACWYHAWNDDENTFGYETWLYATIAVWGFDRVARLARILKTGFRRSRVTEISSTIVRIDIPGIRWTAPGHSVYVYFPTLTLLRPWQNHPFSMIPTPMLSKPKLSIQAETENSDVEKNQTVTVGSGSVTECKAYTNSGLTLFIRKTSGMTKLLHSHEGLLTLLEGPYPTNPTKGVLQTDRLLLIGGGIGITGLVPFLRCHSNIKLFYSIRTSDQCLVDNLGPLLDEVKEKDINVGNRLCIDNILREEANLGWSKIGVVVCGPAGMCDCVRAAVAVVSRDKARTCSFELEVDSFSF